MLPLETRAINDPVAFGTRGRDDSIKIAARLPQEWRHRPNPIGPQMLQRLAPCLDEMRIVILSGPTLLRTRATSGHGNGPGTLYVGPHVR